MFVTGIPSKQIIREAARRNKDYELDFINTETNNDTYNLKVFLRHSEDQYKVRLTLISSILAYPALEMIWVFDKDEYELASRVFHRICDEVDDIKTHYDRSMMPVSTLAAQIREYVKPISSSHQEKSNNLRLDEASRLAGVSDWRHSIYQDRYPNMTKKEKEAVKFFEGNIEESPLSRKEYSKREKY